MKQIKKILYPTDLSSISLPALEYALTFVRLFGAKIYVLNIIDNLFYNDLTFDTPETNDFFRSIEEIARTDLKKYFNESFENSSGIFQVVKYGNPKDEILKFAEEENIDLIIFAGEDQADDVRLQQNGLMVEVISRTEIPVLSLNNPSASHNNSYYTVKDDKFQLNKFGLTLFN